MTKVLVTESHLNDIAEAIRSKNGAATSYRPGDMADAIEALDTSGIHPTGTVAITVNGTTDVTNYASANVNVQPSLGTKSITANGTYYASSDGYDGYSNVSVNVPSGGGGDSWIDFEATATEDPNYTIETVAASFNLSALSWTATAEEG